MDCAEEDLDLLLALQSDFRVQDSPPASKSPLGPRSTMLFDEKENFPNLKLEGVSNGYAAKRQGTVHTLSHTYRPGYGSFSKDKTEPLLDYCSDEEVPKPKSAINMASFKPFVKKVAMLPTAIDFPHHQSGSLRASSVDIEVFSGLKIKNRCVSTTSLSSKLSDLRFIRLQAIKNALIGDSINGTWATVGIIAEKGNPKVSTDGKNYVIWRLTVFDDTPISVFLFGAAYSCHWKESAGSVIVLFNAKVRQDAKKGEFSLSVFSGDQVLLVGSAADFGVCKGSRKDGNSCNVVINRRQGEFCKYHSVASIQKYKTKRGELSGGNLATGFTGPTKSRYAQVLKAFEDTPIDKPVKRVKYLSSSELAKALSNADKVTTRTSSQGIRFLTRVADESSAKCLQQKKENEKRKCLTREKVTFQAEGTVLKEKTLNVIADGTVQGQNNSRIMELDLEGSDDELEKALLLFKKS